MTAALTRLAAAEAEAQAARARADAAARDADRRRALVRDGFTSGLRMRVEVTDALADLVGLDEGVAAMEAAVDAALAARDAARPPVADARRALARWRREAELRADLLRDAQRLERRLRDDRADADAAEQWQAARPVPGVAAGSGPISGAPAS